ncbi:hypothetical protein LOTGIDRAFT_155164 [Lottia gigantea]|uniref:Uncharacterized protein n=1 Tax=Lottia gigantea TaxID=225164 RepID=V3ZXH3_LOTGI|nr:hypothetical protein LOTGIDRAFT_155164 [Lottia gigantea]ESO85671.1 hypothetical protein LOTGIDRAFT_155164 [Lottia gigantea]
MIMVDDCFSYPGCCSFYLLDVRKTSEFSATDRGKQDKVDDDGAGVENDGSGVDDDGESLENDEAGLDDDGAGVDNDEAGFDDDGAGLDNNGVVVDEARNDDDGASSTIQDLSSDD